jgi:phosphatidate phosphatase PAH1
VEPIITLGPLVDSVISTQQTPQNLFCSNFMLKFGQFGLEDHEAIDALLTAL